MKTGKAGGPDNICAKMLKFCCKQLFKPLHVLFQASLKHCMVPYLWKTSKIAAVPKPSYVSRRDSNLLRQRLR